MSPIFRHDGEWTVFRVEFLSKDGNWCDASDNSYFLVNVPARIRSDEHHRSKAPFQDFCASGECWQRIGLHATFDEEKAFRLAELLSKYNPGTRFRVVKHICSQQREELGSFHRTVKDKNDADPATKKNRDRA